MKNKRRRSRATGMDTTPTQSKKENVKIFVLVANIVYLAIELTQTQVVDWYMLLSFGVGIFRSLNITLKSN